MNKEKKKPIKLEVEVNLLELSAPEHIRVGVNGQLPLERTNSQESETPKSLSGSLKLRREVKGRAGKPVTVLYDFSDPNAGHSASLKQLQSLLKVKLACGGTFSPADSQIVLQVDDLAKVRAALTQLGFSVKG
jgi:translation initiation factor 1 (eIF-1/SUI1)